MPDDWTRIEAEATVADYFAMLECEVRGVGYSKAEHRRHLLSQLNQRSAGAVERKHQNVSAILIELGFAYISGYKPLRNYQHLLFEIVADRIQISRPLVAVVSEQVLAPAEIPQVDDILAAWVEPPTPDRPARQPRDSVTRSRPTLRVGVDYLATEARNRSLGGAGEEFVVRFETARLLVAGNEQLAGKVERVSETRGDGLGFDILSYEATGEERLIEVKTTAYGPSTPFFVTRNEVAVSREKRNRYHLYRLFDFRRHPRLFGLSGPLDDSLRLEPSQFVANLG